MVTQMILTNCNVVDVLAGSVTSNAGVWITGNQIAGIGALEDVRKAAQAQGVGAGHEEEAVTSVDLGGAHVLPGLFNMHVHFGLILPGVAGDRMQNETEAALALRMAQNARESLLSGVT